MGTLNRMLNTAKSIGRKIKNLARANKKPDVINESKEKNEERYGGGGTWRQDQGCYRSGFVKKMFAKNKAKRKVSHNSRIVNAGGKKS